MSNIPSIDRDAISRLSCPGDIKAAISDYTEKLAQILDKKITSLCVCGSLARKCFHPAISDIDLIAVTSTPCAESCISSILRVHQQAGIPIDAFFVTADQLYAEEVPTPIDFVVKLMPGVKVIRLPSGSHDFLLQRQDAYEGGVALIGPTCREVFRPVPWTLLSQCLDHIFRHVVEKFKYPILVFCRLVYAYNHRELGSKKIAGEWASGEFSKQWVPIIGQSLERYNETFLEIGEFLGKYLDEIVKRIDEKDNA